MFLPLSPAFISISTGVEYIRKEKGIFSDMSIGCGVRSYTVQYIYQTTYSLPAYLKPWGGDFVIVIQNGHILGMVRRDKRPILQKLRDRIQLYWNNKFPQGVKSQDVAGDDGQHIADCCA
jgi:hypothetical protein